MDAVQQGDPPVYLAIARLFRRHRGKTVGGYHGLGGHAGGGDLGLHTVNWRMKERRWDKVRLEESLLSSEEPTVPCPLLLLGSRLKEPWSY